MPLFNSRDLTDYTHIDADFTSCNLALNDQKSYYKVRFYPWWQHPKVIEASKSGRNDWQFTDIDSLKKDVIVYPQDLIEFKISSRTEVIEWYFTGNHPVLWQYEDEGEINCNSTFTYSEFIALFMNQKNLGFAPKEILRYFGADLKTNSAPFTLPKLPLTLHNLALEILRKMGVQLFISRIPELKPLPEALIIDEDDYIVADAFTVEIPEWEHPAAACRIG